MNNFFDANKIYEAGTKAIKAAPFKYKSQLFEINHLVETAELQKAMLEGRYRPTKGTKFTIKERGTIRKLQRKHQRHKVNHQG